MICQKCGHVQPSPSELQVLPIGNWEKHVDIETANAVKQKTFNRVIGVDENGKKYITLHLSVLVERSIRASMMECPPPVEEIVEAAYKEKIAPTLAVLRDNFKILGNLHEPAFTPLAIVNLTQPFAAFTFVTVEQDPFFMAKLSKLNLETLLKEGAVGTLGTYSV